MSTASKSCPKCGQPILADAPAGLCPRCLAVGAFSDTAPAKNPATATDPDSTLHIVIPEDSRLPPDAPRKLGKYELIEEIARGGMGVVYKAWQPGLERFVAVKTIRSGLLATSADVERFQREAKAAAKLRHPNIIAIHEIGEQDGQHYFAMDYVPGENLATLARQQPFLPEQAAQITATVANAIHYAHQQSVLHRDLKPANVILSPDGPRVLDFGLARLQQDDSQLTQTGTPMGSPCYMSPEQAAGSVHTVDARSDVYSLGAMLYELLTGRPPFQAASVMETLQLVQQTEPVPPRRLNPALPADVETICLKCLEKEPAKRYATAQELADELGRFLADKPIQARRVTQAERAWRWARRNPVVAILAASLALALVLGFAGVLWQWQRAVHQKSIAQEIAVESRQRQVRLNVAFGTKLIEEGDLLSSLPWLVEAMRLDQGNPAREEMHRLRIESVLQRSPQLVQIGFYDGRVDTIQFSPDGGHFLTVVNKASWTGSSTGEVRVCDATTGELAFAPLEHKGIIHYAAFSPDGRFIVSGSAIHGSNGSWLGEARVWDASTGTPVIPPIRYDDDGAGFVAFAPDSRRVVTLIVHSDNPGPHRSHALVWDATTGKPLTPLLPLTGPARWAAFSPNGQRLLISGKSLQVCDTESGKVLFSLPDQLGDRDFATFSPNGQRILTDNSIWGSRGEARIYDANTGALLLTNMVHADKIYAGRFSPDGSRILTLSFDRTARVWNATNGIEMFPPLKHRYGVQNGSFSADGRRIATASYDCTAQVWDAYTGAKTEPPLLHEDWVNYGTFSPDGQRLLTRSGRKTTRVWNLAASHTNLLVLGHEGPVRHIEFSPDGRLIATASADGNARVWNAESGQPVVTLRHSKAVVHASFSPDSRRLVTAAEDHTARVWDANSGAPIGNPLSHDDIVWHAEFSPDGQRVLTASGQFFGDVLRFRQFSLALSNPAMVVNDLRNKIGEARLWDAVSGTLLFSLRHSNTVTHAEFSPDGQLIVTASVDKTSRVWDAVNGQPICAPLTNQTWVYHASFSHDNRRVVSACSDYSADVCAAQVWDAKSGAKVLPQLTHGDGVLFAQFSPDGSRIATTCEDGTARVWDATTGQPVTPILQHGGGYVVQVAFSPDGRRIATCGWSGVARVWDAATGETVTPPLQHPDKAMCVAFSPDGYRLATACDDGKARVWDFTPKNYSLEDLELLTQLLSARKIDNSGSGLELLDRNTLSNAWRTLRVKYPHGFTATGRGAKPGRKQ